VGWALLIFGMEFPGIVALTDCYQRSPMKFAGGARDRAAWLKWLIVALFLMPIGVGYGILLGYHWNVIKRQPFAALEDEEEELRERSSD
jgi:hypothetical protein